MMSSKLVSWLFNIRNGKDEYQVGSKSVRRIPDHYLFQFEFNPKIWAIPAIFNFQTRKVIEKKSLEKILQKKEMLC